MTATFDVLPETTLVEGAEQQLATAPIKTEAALGSMVNDAFVDATTLEATTTIAVPATEQRPEEDEPVTAVEGRHLEAYEPVDDRFTHAARNSMTPGQRLRLAAKESVHPLPESTESTGVTMSTYHARRLRDEAARMRNPVTRHTFLRHAGLEY